MKKGFELKIQITLRYFLALTTLMLITSCKYTDMLKSVEQKAKKINSLEKVAMELSKENRQLKVEIKDLEYEIQNLKTKSSYLELKLKQDKSQHPVGRNIASITNENDGVNYQVYKWKPQQLLMMAQEAFNENNFVKSLESFSTLLKQYPDYDQINDKTYFAAGVAAYNTNDPSKYSYAKDYFTIILSRYSSSKYYRSAKLWLALTYFKQNNNKDFFHIVDEFRLKYRNTTEWKILSTYYENYRNKFKK